MAEYECSLTGTVMEGSEPDTHTKDDDLPVGWTKITIVRRAYNPSFLMIQQVKNRLVQGLIAQLPPELQATEELAVRFQVEAQFASLEANTPRYERDIEETVYLSDTGDVLESFNEVRELLGLEKLVFENDEDEDDDDGEGESAEEPGNDEASNSGDANG